MSWFKFNKSDKDREKEKEWFQNIGNNIKFFDEETNSYFIPSEDEWLPIPTVEDDSLDNSVDITRIQVSKKNGKKRYYLPRKPIPKKIRQHLMAMRGFACENCQENSYSHIHHIDGNPSNNSLDNLRLLCLNCHKLIHAEMRKEE